MFDFRNVEAPDGEESGWDPKNVFSYWIDRSKNCLSFLLVATSFYNNTSRIVITEVQLSGNSPSDATFITRSCATFRTRLARDEDEDGLSWLNELTNEVHGPSESWKVLLNDRYYVELDTSRSSMKVYDYRTLIGNSDDLLLELSPGSVVIKDGKRIEEIRFIHDNILVALSSNSKIYIFEIHQPQTIPKVKQLHVVNMNGPTVMFSPIKWFPDASEIIFFNTKTSLPWAHLRIPHDKSAPPKTTCNLNGPEVQTFQTRAGFFWSLVQRLDLAFKLEGLHFLKQQWGLTTSQCRLSHMSVSLPGYAYGSNVETFSEEVGYVVMAKERRKKKVLQLTLVETDMQV